MSDVTVRLTPPFTCVLAYPTRIRILGALVEAEKPLIQKEIVEHADIARSAFASHSDMLVELGLIERDRQGRRIEYRLADSEGVSHIVGLNDYLEQEVRGDDDLAGRISEMYS